jgi:hypothetical protein
MGNTRPIQKERINGWNICGRGWFQQFDLVEFPVTGKDMRADAAIGRTE